MAEAIGTEETITILLPHGEVEGIPENLAPRLSTLEGKKVGLINNELWRSMHILQDELEKVLMGEYGVAGTESIYIGPGTGAMPQKYVDEIEGLTQKVDAVISGLGN